MSDMMTRPPFMADRLENEISFARLIDHLIIWSPGGIWNNRRPVLYAVDVFQNIRTICFVTGSHNSSHHITSYCISINALITTLEITTSYNYISYQIISNHIMLVLIAYMYMPRKKHHDRRHIITIITNINTSPSTTATFTRGGIYI